MLMMMSSADANLSDLPLHADNDGDGIEWEGDRLSSRARTSHDKTKIGDLTSQGATAKIYDVADAVIME